VSKQSDPHEWLRFAHDDLAAARLLLTDIELPARMACFHAQQAAEKALKGLDHLVGLDRDRTAARPLIATAEPVRA
jgi:HEPN domain-containing protein